MENKEENRKEHIHDWEILGQYGRRFMPWSRFEPVEIVYVCKICLEKRSINV